MTKIIVDTNIAFSALLNINSRIGQILLNGNKYFDFYSPEYMRLEILQHKEKIKKIGKLSNNQFIQTYELVLKNISVLNHSIIPVDV